MKIVIKVSTENRLQNFVCKICSIFSAAYSAAICSIFSAKYIDKITGKGEKRSVPKKGQFPCLRSRSKDLYLHNEGACVSKNLRRTFWKTGKLDPAREAEEMDSFSSKTSDSPHL